VIFEKHGVTVRPFSGPDKNYPVLLASSIAARKIEPRPLPPSDASIMSCDPGSVISCPTGSHSAEDEKADATSFKRRLVTVSAQPGRPVPVPNTSAPANLPYFDDLHVGHHTY
jgi:hypothetical protein